jgi:hypothetical protein
VVTVLGVMVLSVALIRARRAAASGAGARGLPGLWAAWLRPSDAVGGLRLVQTVRLTPRASLHLVRWNDRELLVACSERGVEWLGGGAPAGAGDGAPPEPTPVVGSRGDGAARGGEA